VATVGDWIEANSMLLAVAGAVSLLFALVFLILWLRARRGRRTQQHVRVDAELDVIDLELLLAEQTNRLRIIRELHEVTVHDLSTIISQADGAQYSGATDPTAAVRAASAIADSARATLANLRRVMTIVHEGEAEAPQPLRLQSAQELLEVMTEAGLKITFEETGTPFDLAGGAEVSVFRILQEGLANALAYGGPGTEVSVQFQWTETGFGLRIDDDGVRAARRRHADDPVALSQQAAPDIEDDLAALTGVVTGPGITEMKERTELFGGVFTATVVPGVGFSISASFPDLKYHNGIHGVNL
jgi:signal transduction histidine kinase